MTVLIRSSGTPNYYDKYYEHVIHPDKWYIHTTNEIVGIYLGDLWRIRDHCPQVLFVYCFDSPFTNEYYPYVRDIPTVYVMNPDLPLYDNIHIFPRTGVLREWYKQLVTQYGIVIRHNYSHPIRNLFPCEPVYEPVYNRYVLVCRGTGLDTYRLWESLDNGCIPVMIATKEMTYFRQYVDKFAKEKRVIIKWINIILD